MTRFVPVYVPICQAWAVDGMLSVHGVTHTGNVMQEFMPKHFLDLLQWPASYLEMTGACMGEGELREPRLLGCKDMTKV
jgi:hypothetical protein